MSSTSTVLYFNRGTSCYVRLLVSVFSVRKHYCGTITLMQEGPLDAIIAEMLAKLGVRVQPIVESNDSVLVKRASLWHELRHDYALSFDADTIVCGPVDDLFDRLRQWGFVATWFSGWSTARPVMRKRIGEWACVAPSLVPPALAYGKAINGGVQGWSRGAPVLAAYEDLTRRGDAAGCNAIVLDEIALQLLLPHHRHFLAHHAWNTSGVFGAIRQARIVHYHGKKHCQLDNPRCDLWKTHYFELCSSFPGWDADALDNTWGDERLRRFLNSDEAASHRRDASYGRLELQASTAYSEQLR
jgi:hypothetical protein